MPLFSTTPFIHNELDNTGKVIVVFLDLAKTFDTVNQKIALQILPTSSFRIDNNSSNWFESYHLNRNQTVSINDVIGQESIVEHGVPQGIVLELT